MDQSALPDVFDLLAAICKFIAVPKIEPEFHKRHYHAVGMASAFIRVLASNHGELLTVFKSTLHLPVSEAAEALRQSVPTIGLSEKEVQWIDAQMTEILRVLVPVVRDKSLPAWLAPCKEVIEGAVLSTVRHKYYSPTSGTDKLRQILAASLSTG